jgi:hypothetical protein
MVRHKGTVHPGRRTPIVPQNLFDQVQEPPELRGVTNSRYRVHSHALKGLLYCGECRDKRGVDKRMVLQKADGNGGRYWYFFCSGHADHTGDSPFVNVIRAEDAVTECYQTLGLDPGFIAALRQGLAAITDETDQLERQTRRQVGTLLEDLDLREVKLIELAVDDALPRHIIHDELARVVVEREKAGRQAEHLSPEAQTGSEALDAPIGLLTDPDVLLRRLRGDLTGQHLLHTAIFERIYVYQDTITHPDLVTSLCAQARLWFE